MDSAIMAANERQEYVTQDWEARDLYRRRQKAQWDLISDLNGARMEGEQKGQEKKALEIARNALAEGAAPEFVRKITGLDMETIQGLSQT